MDENIISLNWPNFITVGLILVVSFTAFGFAAQLWHNRNGAAMAA
jgi:hypothetical protein